MVGGVEPPPPPPPPGGEFMTSLLADPGFDQGAPTYRDGTALTGVGLSAFDRLKERLNWYLNSYQAGVLDYYDDVFAIAAGGNSYHFRYLVNDLAKVAGALAVAPWEGFAKFFGLTWEKLASSRKTKWNPKPGTTAEYPAWTETNYPQWHYLYDNGGPNDGFVGRDNNPIEEENVGCMLGFITRVCYENRHIPECATAYQEAYEHYRYYHLPKWVPRIQAYSLWPKYSFYEDSTPFVRPFPDHPFYRYLVQLGTWEEVGPKIDPTWGAMFAGRFDNICNTQLWVNDPDPNLSPPIGLGVYEFATPYGTGYALPREAFNQATAGFNIYISGVYVLASLLAVLRPDQFSDAKMQGFVNSIRDTFFRVPASSIVSRGDYSYIYMSQNKGYTDSTGTNKVAGDPLVITNPPPSELPPPPISGSQQRTPMTPSQFGTNNCLVLGAWEPSLLEYNTTIEALNGANVPNPENYNYAAISLFAEGWAHR